jgi:hypothetical protein
MQTLQFSETSIVDLKTQYGLIGAHGIEALNFLQGQLTCDMRLITSENSGLGAYCNIKGRIRALFRIFKIQPKNEIELKPPTEQEYLLLLPKGILSQTLAQLKKYSLFSKVTLKDVSDEWECLGVIGNKTDTSNLFSSLDHFHLDQSSLNNSIHSVMRFNITTDHLATPQTPRSILLNRNPAPSTNLISNPLQNHLAKHAPLVDFETWKLLDIRAGIPQIWPEIVEQFLPHDLNLPTLGAVSFNKGCYCGQEIIARMEYRAKLKRHLYSAKLCNFELPLPLPGTPLFTEHATEPSGTIISVSWALNHTVEMLIETLDQYQQEKVPLYIHISNLENQNNTKIPVIIL